MGSKGDVKHSVCAFFAWHGRESCWCFGLFESDADETVSSHRPESTFRTVFCLGRGSTAAGVRVFLEPKLCFLIVFYGFQRWREAFCLRVFCLAWARILLVFRSFRIWRWRDCEQPSAGIHVSNGFLLGRGSTAAGVRVWRWRDFELPSFGIQVSKGFLLGRGSTHAGVRLFRSRSFVF